MRKLLLAGLIVGTTVACGGSTPPPSGVVTPAEGVGAPTPSAAVDQFLGAVRAKDLQAMSIVWGTARGPARDNIDRAELEKREIVLQCYFNHDSYKILDETKTEEGRRLLNVELTRGSLVRTTAMYTVQGPHQRWFVEKMDIAALRDFCGS